MVACSLSNLQFRATALNATYEFLGTDLKKLIGAGYCASREIRGED